LVLTKVSRGEEDSTTIEECQKHMLHYVVNIRKDYKYKNLFENLMENFMMKNMILIKKPSIKNNNQKFEPDFLGENDTKINLKE
jgi:hypothetical protein